MTGIDEGKLRALLDKQAIAEVLYRYCRASDRADEALMRDCFHPGSTHRHGRFAGTSEDFVTFAMKIIAGSIRTKHLLTNVLVELDGDVAFSESHYFAYHRRLNAETGVEEDNFSGGRYLDRFERRAGRWKIVERVGLMDFERHDPATDRNFGKLLPEQRSGRYPDDELYRRFTLDAVHPRS
jgi:hypothetical protein